MEIKMNEQAKETWGSGRPYEQYVGRWSRKVAKEFLAWLGVSSGQRWSDIGCGTGALVESILGMTEPKSIFAIDRSEGFLAEARAKINDYWIPFLGKQGAAPTYLASLSDEKRDSIRDALQARLPSSADGSIHLTARAWAVKGAA